MKDTIEFLDYVDTEVLKVSFATLIIKVESLNEKYGSLSRFAEACRLWGITNGKIYCLCEMMMPPPSIDSIIDELLHPMGMIHKEDFAFMYECMVDDSRLNKAIPGIEDIPWLGSRVNFEGNFVWLK